MIPSITLVYKHRTGLLPGHITVVAPPTEVRATIPVVEALTAAGATVDPIGEGVYGVTLAAVMPPDIVAVWIPERPFRGIRLDIEPEYPGERPNVWIQAEWAPCPVCGAPVVWYEAGYVPGYRVCTLPPHHHCLWSRKE